MKDIFYHPFFMVQFWIVSMIIAVRVFIYFGVSDGWTILILTFSAANLIALHFVKSSKHGKDKKASK